MPNIRNEVVYVGLFGISTYGSIYLYIELSKWVNTYIYPDRGSNLASIWRVNVDSAIKTAV